MQWLALYLPGFAVALAFVCAERAARAPRTDWAINLMSWAIQIVVALSVLKVVRGWEGASLIDASKLPFWAGILVPVLVFDLMEYLFHRLQHRIPWLWAMHSLHHSDPEMSALTTERHFWADPIIKTLTVWSLGAMIVAPTNAAVAVYIALSRWNFFTHSRLRIDLGRWSWVINSPAYHRRHHSSLPEHYDSNFAALFPIWDVLAGTYFRPRGFPPTGLDQRPRSIGDLIAWPLRYARDR